MATQHSLCSQVSQQKKKKKEEKKNRQIDQWWSSVFVHNSRKQVLARRDGVHSRRSSELSLWMEKEEWGGVRRSSPLFPPLSELVHVSVCVCERRVEGVESGGDEGKHPLTSFIYWTVTLMQTNKAKLWPQSHKNKILTTCFSCI